MKTDLEKFIISKCYCGYLKDFKSKTKLEEVPAFCIYCKVLNDFYKYQEAAKGGVDRAKSQTGSNSPKQPPAIASKKRGYTLDCKGYKASKED